MAKRIKDDENVKELKIELVSTKYGYAHLVKNGINRGEKVIAQEKRSTWNKII